MRRTQSLLTLFLVLCAGTGFTEGMKVYNVTEGGNLTVTCLMFAPGDSRSFCKNDGDTKVLVEINAPKTEKSKGRYSVQYEERAPPPHVLHVSITDVEISDSGTYTCETWYGGIQGSSVKFQVNITRASTSSDSDGTVASSASGYGLLMLLMLIFVAVVMTSVSVFLICRKKRTQSNHEATENPRRSNAETPDYGNVGPVSAESTYQSLCLDTVDQNQTYSCIRDTHQ